MDKNETKHWGTPEESRADLDAVRRSVKRKKKARQLRELQEIGNGENKNRIAT